MTHDAYAWISSRHWWALEGHPVPVILPRCVLCVLSHKWGMMAAEVGIVEQLATALLALASNSMLELLYKDYLADICGQI